MIVPDKTFRHVGSVLIVRGWARERLSLRCHIAGQAPLQATVAGQTLDVSTGGEVGE